MKKLLTYSLLLLISLSAYSQDIEQGSWRTHFNYQSAGIIQATATKVFCASENGLFYVDQEDNTVNILTKIDGFSDVGISAMGYSPDQNILILGYQNGNIDLFSGNGITNIDLVKNQNIVQDKRIGNIHIKDEFAYLSTDFGIVVLDLSREVISEVFREIGPEGIQPSVFATQTANDSIFAVTSSGLLSARLSDNINLLDFNNWQQISVPVGVSEFRLITATTSNSEIILANDEEIYNYLNGVFTLITDQFDNITSVKAQPDGSISIISGGIGYFLQNGGVSQIPNESSERLADISIINNELWLADLEGGLKKVSGSTFQQLSPNSPGTDDIQNLVYQDGKIYAFGPFRTEGFSPLNKSTFAVFENGSWSNEAIESFSNVSDISDRYFGSFGDGLYDAANQNTLTDTPLMADSRTGRVIVTDIETNEQGLWVANFNSDNPLHLLNNEGDWESYDLNGRASEIIQIAVSGNVWIRDNNSSITIYDPELDEVTVVNANNSDLPSSIINDISIDLDDEVWVATERGVAFFPSASVEISNFNTAILPVFENNFLFRDEVINSITTDPGNRKWIGNTTGAWLLEEAGESLVTRFTAENSPLPSDNVLDISINPQNGEVFFVTDKGMVSFRSDATESTAFHSDVKIFPNPVRPNFNGLVGFNGLATDVRLKITDISGKLIREIEANGGGASWDLRDINGNKARTGVYLVFSADREGEETYIGKLAIVN
ncbi:MAG: hypothetical protein AAFQ94_03675 [Bacteroidota bacterium]